MMNTVVTLVSAYRAKTQEQRSVQMGLEELRSGVKKMERMEVCLEREAMDILGDIHKLTDCEDINDVLDHPERYEPCSTAAV